uniref:Rho gtpase-activating protein n=1 Tax=Tetraselmis sp. GSL018 TaxID=582737 RepID=A0A061RHC3_9CHLO|mmetsp:Transcript_1599/g.3670  ORF Transcript_1599/g.3670 Transcript_1599/m.3670 type:complete len:287 (-) Transcript_1599:280-1140(-)
MKGLNWAKDKANAAAAMVGEVAKNTGDTIKQHDWRREKETWDHFKTGTTRTVQNMTNQAAASGQFLMRQGSETLKRFGIYGGATLEARCRQESQSTPCPRALLVCCNSIVAGDTTQKGIFKDDGPGDLVGLLFSLLAQGNGVVLIPKGTTAVTVASAVKSYLRSLPEPLLTYRLVNDFIMAGHNPSQAQQLLQSLPSANYNSLVLLLDCAKRVSDDSASNGMTSRLLAEVLTPCLLWHPPPKELRDAQVSAPPSDQGAGPQPYQMLSEEQLQSVATVVEHLIETQA